jgi:hypothetical protein
MPTEDSPDNEPQSPDPSPKDTRRRRAARAAPELGGGLAGAGASLGAVAALGPAGGLVGPLANSAVQRLLRRLGVDRLFSNAYNELAQRREDAERQRAEAALGHALTALAERLDAGERIRDDGFFDRPHEEDGRTPAEELLEGVLRKARDAHEARKAERLGRLFAYLAVSPEVTRNHANYLVDLAGRLTYQQLLLLGAFAKEESRTAMPDWQSTGSFTVLETGLVAAIQELAQQELLVRDDNRAVATFADVNPRRLRTVLNGKLLVEAMGLTAAEEEDWLELYGAFARLGVIESKGEGGSHSFEAVVPRGKPPDVKRVEIAHRLVEFTPPTLGLEDVEDSDDPV